MGFISEDELQALVARHPPLLGGEQMNPEAPRRWLLVRREAGLAGAVGEGARWSLDHLFVDQDGIPTIVEVKRSTDTRVRREVVGQMLDYAANAVVYLPVDRIRAWFEDRCAAEGQDAGEVMRVALQRDDPDVFWALVGTNLLAGRLRLVFVADVIPPELVRIVEFLNRQMSPAEVVAVEISRFASGSLASLVPRVLTSPASKAAPGTRRLDEADFWAGLAKRPAEEAVVRKLVDWARSNGVRTVMNRGSMGFHFDSHGTYYPFFNAARGRHIELGFGTLASRPVFESNEQRAELARRLNEGPGVSIGSDKIDRYPTIPTTALSDARALDAFTNAFDWVIQTLRSRADG